MAKNKSGWFGERRRHRLAALKSRGTRSIQKPKTKLKRIGIFIHHAEGELGKYRMNNQEIHLQQASEKMWGAYNLLIEHMSGREIRSPAIIKQKSWAFIDSGKLSKKLYNNADGLHSYFYEGRRDERIVYEEIRETIGLLKKQIRKLT